MERIEVKVCKNLLEKGLKISTAESCTGGMIAAMITSVPGASGCFDMGVVTYSNEQKMNLLGVKSETLLKYGAVSEETALAMCKGVRTLSKSNIGISVTGIAGPGGGSEKKPVGTVWIGVSTQNFHNAQCFLFEGSRDDVRQKAATKALELANSCIEEKL